MHLLLVFARTYPYHSALVLGCLLVSAVFEGIGFSSLLPLLSMTVADQTAAGTDEPPAWLEQQVSNWAGDFWLAAPSRDAVSGHCRRPRPQGGLCPARPATGRLYRRPCGNRPAPVPAALAAGRPLGVLHPPAGRGVCQRLCHRSDPGGRGVSVRRDDHLAQYPDHAVYRLGVCRVMAGQPGRSRLWLSACCWC